MARHKGKPLTKKIPKYLVAKDSADLRTDNPTLVIDFVTERTRPDHYKEGIDTFDRMEANCNLEERLAFVKGGIDKYNWRKKGQDLADFKKIIDYSNFAIKQLNDEKIKNQK